MSWDVRDSQHQRYRPLSVPSDDPGVPALPRREPHAAPGVSSDSAPLGGLTMSWGDEADEDTRPAWPQDMAREMAAQGIVSEQEWQRYARLMRRGVTEV